MRAKDLVVGESYRHKDHPSYCWAKVIAVMPPKTKRSPFNRILVKCEYSVCKDAPFGLIKYFKASDLRVGE